MIGTTTAKLSLASTALTFIAIGGKAAMKIAPRAGAIVMIGSYTAAGVMAVCAAVSAFVEA